MQDMRQNIWAAIFFLKSRGLLLPLLGGGGVDLKAAAYSPSLLGRDETIVGVFLIRLMWTSWM
jgi:hypothetical protein